MENKILFINRCDYSIEDFCKEFFVGSELIDGYVLKYENKEYCLIQCQPVGMIVQRDIQIYTLSESAGKFTASHPTTLPSDEEIETGAKVYAESENDCYNNDYNGYRNGAKDMRYICLRHISQMESEMKRLEALNKQYSDFRKAVLQIPDELIKEIDNKYFPF